MWQDIFSSAKSLGSNAMSFVLQAVENRQVGANEAADRLLGNKLYSRSRQLRFADLQPQHKAKRILKPIAEIERLLQDDPDSENIFHLHWVFDIYPDRPDSLETCCLYDLVGWYEREKLTPNCKQDMQLKHHSFYLRHRNQPYIVTHQLVNPNQSDEAKETYYYYLLKLFKPWRTESDIYLAGKTFYESYVHFKEQLPGMVRYHEQTVNISNQDEEVETAIKQRAAELRTVDDGVEPEDAEGAFNGCAIDHVQSAMNDLLEAHLQSVRLDQLNDEELSETYKSLNVDQTRIVDNVVSSVCASDKPIRLVVSGQGGTGKSRVINVMNRLVCKQLSSNGLPVIVAAPTGLAAFNIGGTTIHRVLSLPVEHGKPADYCRLSQDQLTTVRATLKNNKLLILDEVSMVSSLTLLYIHLRLTEIMCNSSLFGGISVVLFADFLQLPPVKGNQPFLPVSFLEVKQRIGAISPVDLWQSFTYDELTINMRQKGDNTYAELLSSLRIGMLTDEHCNMLSSRLLAPGRRATVLEVCSAYNRLLAANSKPLILLPRSNLCDEVNKAMLHQIGATVHNLVALDTRDTIVQKHSLPKVEKAYNKMSEDTTRTAGLEKQLQLCIGARVMLKRNKDVDAGLVNGSVGTVVEFSITNVQDRQEINSVVVKFENIECLVNIQRESYSFEVLKCIYYTRKQFPLMLAFAITIHKAQGLSLESAIVDVGSNTFGCGMTYVALSRVTALTGLHLIDFDKTKVKCDTKAIVAYNRLRQLYTPYLGNIETAVSTTDQINRPHTVDTSNISKKTRAERKKRQKQENNSKSQPIEVQQVNTSDHQSITNPTATLNSKSIINSHKESVYEFSSVDSLDSNIQKSLCLQYNLAHVKNELPTTPCVERAVARKLEAEIHRQTQRSAKVTIYQIGGEGNCLFKALSLAITGTQSQHELIRSYIVNHMMNSDVTADIAELFLSTHNNDSSAYESHLVAMQQTGEWGTDQEIVAAAHLFNCSVLCYSRYGIGNRQYGLQHFSPHFATEPMCSSNCRHQTVYLVNSCGSHYNLAFVSTGNETEE